MALDVWTVVPDRDHDPRAVALRTDIGGPSAATSTSPSAWRRGTPAAGAGGQPPAPRVDLVAGASETATVVEVRAATGPACSTGSAARWH